MNREAFSKHHHIAPVVQDLEAYNVGIEVFGTLNILYQHNGINVFNYRSLPFQSGVLYFHPLGLFPCFNRKLFRFRIKETTLDEAAPFSHPSFLNGY